MCIGAGQSGARLVCGLQSLLDLLFSAQLESLASLDGGLVRESALTALELEHNLLGGLNLRVCVGRDRVGVNSQSLSIQHSTQLINAETPTKKENNNKNNDTLKVSVTMTKCCPHER